MVKHAIHKVHIVVLLSPATLQTLRSTTNGEHNLGRCLEVHPFKGAEEQMKNLISRTMPWVHPRWGCKKNEKSNFSDDAVGPSEVGLQKKNKWRNRRESPVQSNWRTELNKAAAVEISATLPPTFLNCRHIYRNGDFPK